MKRLVQIYVADADNVLQRLDLFKDETISVTDTIQDVRDIAKVFTEFSQSFTVPASKTNNKVFRHFYNADISDGYDSRLLHNARIEINSIPFKKGFVTLEGVDMKDNKPNAYRITFYGETVTLKDIIGDDKLSNLTYPDSLNNTYGPDDILAGLKADPSTNDVIVPLITHTQRLYYDSTSHEKDDGNLYWQSTSSHLHGVQWNQLKYALRVHKIVEAIENTYGITFSDDFFNTSNDTYYDLFMWLHRKSGYVESLSGFPETLITTFDKLHTPGEYALSGQSYSIKMAEDYIELKGTTTSSPYARTFRLTITEQTFPFPDVLYDIRVTKDNDEFFSITNITGSTVITDPDLPSPGDSSIYTNRLEWTYEPGVYKVYITSKSLGLDLDINVQWNVAMQRFVSNNNLLTDILSRQFVSEVSLSSEFPFVISQQIPEMGVIEFLTGLFKMFNLTAFVEPDGTIYVDTLDEFYVDKQSDGSPYTIDEFVDSTKNTVDSALPFREVKFRYEDTGTLLAKQHEQIAGTVWAEEEFNRTKFASVGLAEVNTNISGDVYVVEAPFGHMKYENMLDSNDNTPVNIQWGYSAGDNFDKTTGNYNPYVGKPVLFYPVPFQAQNTGGSLPISFINELDSENNPTGKEQIAVGTSINMPSNSVSFSEITSTANINFKAEVNEYRGFVFEDTLFKVYYETYIKQMFTKSNRIIKLKAYLPLRILLNYTLADKFTYKGRKHQVNSITTNLTTGESEIELLNIVIE